MQSRQVQQESNDITVTLLTNNTTVTFPSRPVLIRDWRRDNGNVVFYFDHPLLGPLQVSVTWKSDYLINYGSVRLNRFSRAYLTNRVLQQQQKGVVQGNCLVKPSSTGRANYISVSLTEDGNTFNTNYHQIIGYLRWGVVSGWINDEYYVISHLCHNINCMCSADRSVSHFSFEPQAVNLSRQRCLRLSFQFPDYHCYGHEYIGLLFPCCILE